MNRSTLLSSGRAFSDIRRSLSSSWGLSYKLECGRSAVIVGSPPHGGVGRNSRLYGNALNGSGSPPQPPRPGADVAPTPYVTGRIGKMLTNLRIGLRYLAVAIGWRLAAAFMQGSGEVDILVRSVRRLRLML